MHPDILYVKMVEPDAGFASDKEKIKSTPFEFSEYYKVAVLSMGQSSTSLKLEEFSEHFNSVHFEFYELIDGKYVAINIFGTPKYNHYIR